MPSETPKWPSPSGKGPTCWSTKDPAGPPVPGARGRSLAITDYSRRVTRPGGYPMTPPLQSLITTGTKVWLDSIDPDEVARNRAWGITGATSNPIIVADLVKTGRLDDQLAHFLREMREDDEV